MNTAEIILLAAHDMGLGFVYLSVFPREIKMQNVSKTLNLPDHLVPLTVLPIGRPDETKPSREEESYKPEKIYYNKYK